MDICKKIYETIEVDSWQENDAIASLFLKEFVNSIDETFVFSKDKTPIAHLENLQLQYIYNSKHINLFFSLLAKYGYNMKRELISAIFELGNLVDPCQNKTMIELFLTSPVIQDISFNGKNKFKILSEQYGEFEFELASYYFRNSEPLIEYMQNNKLPYHCHENSYFISKTLKDLYSITSLCQSYFTKSYYHSYTYDEKRDIIIDLTSNSIIPKEQYDKLHQPREISVILNKEVEKELALVESKIVENFAFCQLLKIALYKQYLNSIGYQGELKQAPYTRKLT